MRFARQFFVLIVALAALPAAGWSPSRDEPDHRRESVVGSGASASSRILANIKEPALRELGDEVLERNPGIAAAAARARSVAQQVPQVKALPDPVASMTAFLQAPETRTGPQRLSLGISQGLPWFGKLELKEQAALLSVAALEADVESRRLRLVTEARRLYYEMSFLDSYEEITDEFRTHLLQHEEIARARYSTGIGSGQGVVKLQAEITRVERQLLDIEARRVALVAQLNALRDRPASFARPEVHASRVEEIQVDLDPSLEAALHSRPELSASDARISRADTLIQLAEKGYRPDFKVGLAYTIVERRNDPAGRLSPPAGNGDDILGIQGGITLPIWRKRLAAGVEEAVEFEIAAREARRAIVAEIQGAVGDLIQRVPLSWRQLRLVEDLLVVQAEEALESAKSGYIAGTLNALDLLDAEHVLFEARTAVARARADYLVGIAKLEGAIGTTLPIPEPTTTLLERTES
jgi:outer membrane protein TolC